MVYPEMYPYISACLTNKHEINTMDISNKRIAILLSMEDGTFVRIAIWDEEEQEYHKTDSPKLSTESYLDTYHDGDAIFLKTEGQHYYSMYLDFALISNDWLLTTFTDGYTIIGKIDTDDWKNTLNDYYVPNERIQLKIGMPMTISDLDIELLESWLDLYEQIYPLHPSGTSGDDSV